MSSMKNSAPRRIFTALHVAFAVALVLVLLGGTNLLARKSIFRARFDLSPQAIFTLSRQTQEKVLGLLKKKDMSVQVEAFFFHPRPWNPAGGRSRAFHQALASIRLQLQDYTRRLLGVYQVESGGRVHVRVYDCDREIQDTKAAAARLHIERRLASPVDLVVVSSGKRKEILTLWDMGLVRIPQVPIAGGTQGLPHLDSFTGEAALSTRIRALCVTGTPRVLFLVGHDEPPPDSTGPRGLALFKRALLQEGFKLGILDLRKKGKVPPSCDILAVIQPQRALTPEEVSEIRDWLTTRGGRIFVAQGWHRVYSVDLNPLIGPFGITLGTNPVFTAVVDPSGTGRPVVTGDEKCRFLMISYLNPSHPITKDLGGARRMWLQLADALPVRVAASLPEGVEAVPLATTNPLCWEGRVDPLRGPIYVPPAGVFPTERFHVAAAGQYAVPGKKKKARCVVLGSSEALLSYMLDRYQVNRDFLVNAFDWLADRTEMVSVAARERKSRTLPPISPQRASRLKFVALLVFPGLVLLFGLAVFFLRRR
ncbi:MAG TPA: hypothetical protein ENJ97_06500 [Planctomycetes bacterium]|nr:hypothetical protein [Planctomycetota bacterium]